MTAQAVDLFAGPGGWDVAARRLGIVTTGVEWDPAACRTAIYAGHARIEADVAALDPVDFIGAEGVIVSPPCTDFSTAGAMLRESGRSGHLVSEVMRWAEVIQPEWLACEQVPQVIHIWQHYAWQLRRKGYSTWTGILNAADYGVPQERERAILLASRTINVAPPVPTHAEARRDTLFGPEWRPWVTMAEALGLPPGCEYDSGQNSRAAGGGTVRYVRSCDRPAPGAGGEDLHGLLPAVRVDEPSPGAVRGVPEGREAGGVTGRLSQAWGAYRDRLLRRCFCCGSWAYDQDDCRECGAPAAVHPRPVREHHHEASRAYLDLCAVADAEIRTQDDEKRRKTA